MAALAGVKTSPSSNSLSVSVMSLASASLARRMCISRSGSPAPYAQAQPVNARDSGQEDILDSSESLAGASRPHIFRTNFEITVLMARTADVPLRISSTRS